MTTIKGTYVPPTRTKISPAAFCAALVTRFDSKGIAASDHALTTLVAMSAHETAEWRSCWNYNLGNVKAAPAWAGQYTCLTNVWERLNGVLRWFSPRGETDGKGGPLIGPEYPVPPGHPQTRFRAYPTLSEGITGFVDKMCGQFRPSLNVLLEGGTVDDFVAALKKQRYFTGDLDGYQAAVRKFYDKFSGPTWPTLKLGDEGYAVYVLNTFLAARCYQSESRGNWGVFTDETNKAVCEFQGIYGLKVDGQVGPITWGVVCSFDPTMEAQLATAMERIKFRQDCNRTPLEQCHGV